MLNLPIAMLTRVLAGLSLILSFFMLGVQTQPPDLPRLTSPQTGAAVQGSLNITGSIPPVDFQYAEISFRYSGSPADTWFLIQQIRQPVKDALLAVWDTTTIADGTYTLRLQVFLTGGRILEVLQYGLRVRNYTAIETNTPTVAPAVTHTKAALPVETATPVPLTPTPRPTPTAFSANPAQIQPSQLTGSLAVGIGAAVVVFLIIGLYQGANKKG
jgi:hypothetical protein